MFKDKVIKPITIKINEILEKLTPTADDIETIKEQLGKYFDVALRIVNKTDLYDLDYGVMQYNEVHLPPLLQLMEAFFVVDDGEFKNIEKKLKIYKTIKDVREILFLPQENHTEENFNTLTPEQKESFKIFFKIKDKDLTFAIYQEKIETFFKNQTTYVERIIRNLDNEKKELEKTSFMELLWELLCCWKKKKTKKEIDEEIKQIDELRLNLLDSIDRKKLPELLKKSFSLQLFDPKSQTIKTEEDLIQEIKNPSLSNLQKQKLALLYIGIGDC